MKLRNKKTGQEGNFIINKDHFECVDLDYVPEYRNLSELNEEWEDAPEEPKEYWYIDYCGCICNSKEDPVSPVFMLKEIGNYFETKKEAEKAVEKLKALKRLNDRGVVLHSCEGAESCENFYRIIFSVRCDRYWSDRSHSVDSDLNLLFGEEG